MTICSEKTLAFLNNAGEMGKLILQHDWDMQGIGHPGDWPMSLKSIANIMLRSRFPMFVAWGSELTFIYNDAYAAILGGKHPAALGRRFEDVWVEIWEEISPIVAAAMEGKSRYFEDMPLTVTRNGFSEIAWFTFSYSPAFSDDGTVHGMFCVCTETTRQVLSQRRKEGEIGRLSELFRQAPGFVAIVKEPRHIFEMANDSYMQLIGHRDVIGKPFAEAIPELAEQGYIDILDTVYRTGTPYIGRAVPVQLRRFLDGMMEECFLDLIFQPVLNDDGIVSGVFIQGHDVSEAVKVARQLKQASRRKDEILSMLAHELRNPFSAIQAAAEVLRLSGEDNLKTRKAGDIIVRQVIHLSKRLDNLLDMSDVNRGKIPLQKTVCDVSLLVTYSIEQVQAKAAEKNQAILFTEKKNSYFILADAVRITQVFANILLNAIEHTPEDGDISVLLARTENAIRVTIDDSGEGVNPDIRPHLFELFSQGEKSASGSLKGLGLGLALARNFTDLHGGHIAFEGEGARGGSRFSVSFPAHCAGAD